MRTPRCTTVGVWRWVRLSTMSMKSLAVGTCQPGAGLVLSAPPQRRRRHRRRKERRRRETHRRYLFKVVQHHGRINFKRSGVGPPLLSAVAWRTKLTHSASQSLAPQPERYQRTRASAAVDAMNFLFFFFPQKRKSHPKRGKIKEGTGAQVQSLEQRARRRTWRQSQLPSLRRPGRRQIRGRIASPALIRGSCWLPASQWTPRRARFSDMTS